MNQLTSLPWRLSHRALVRAPLHTSVLHQPPCTHPSLCLALKSHPVSSCHMQSTLTSLWTVLLPVSLEASKVALVKFSALAILLAVRLWSPAPCAVSGRRCGCAPSAWS